MLGVTSESSGWGFLGCFVFVFFYLDMYFFIMIHSCFGTWAIQPAVQLHQCWWKYRMQLSLTACPAPDLSVLGTNK